MHRPDVTGLPILEDFDLFLTFLRSKKEIPLTNDKVQLKRTDLYRLNEELHFKAKGVTDKSLQTSYPELEFFYAAVQAGKLARICYGEKGNFLQPNPDQLERYSLLTRTEQYFFLLQTAWCYLNWSKLCETRSMFFTDSVVAILQLVAGNPPGFRLEVDVSYSRLRVGKGEISLSLINKVVQIFGFLGFYELEPAVFAKKPDRYTFPFRSIVVAEAGTVLAPVLLSQRPLEQWNVPLRRELAIGEVPLGLTEEEYYQEDPQGYLIPRPAGELVIPAFLPAFAPLFEPGELSESLYSTVPTFTPGLCVLKVALEKQLYRTIAIGASATLDDLHQAIQNAFQFDNDHLYAFFMDGEPWSDDRFNDPRMEESPFASGVKLGELDLYAGKRFLYLFDFGTEWRFRVTVLQVDPSAPEPKSPKVVDKQGKNPKQYSGW
ncbi:MAG: hypothetical protein AVDCRST_MAG56-6950 [uncultured Cytophagales bacterium]|uniref:Plasmid pRiA4b Orf3-like domain-containing protein n=1 Tax=uncultured Cytophagales bacterium TaxID=158755 RepID=A0A6J4L2U5_9SPHI|nr:MAG: hypothetical protein AVDCRST_MAG56-6950 [uncultured Cytophagales bacterium]